MSEQYIILTVIIISLDDVKGLSSNISSVQTSVKNVGSTVFKLANQIGQDENTLKSLETQVFSYNRGSNFIKRIMIMGKNNRVLLPQILLLLVMIIMMMILTMIVVMS